MKRSRVAGIGALLLIFGCSSGGPPDLMAGRSLAVTRSAIEVCDNQVDDDQDGAVDEAQCLITDTSVPVSDNGIVPEQWGDNPACEHLGFSYGFKLDGLPVGTFAFTSANGSLTGGAASDPGNSVTITDTGGTPGAMFDWTATLPIDAVVVKAQSANVYVYIPEASGDGGLAPPLTTSGNAPGVSHIEFCFDYELTVTKTAAATYTRTYEWGIDKAADGNYAMFAGDAVVHDYAVAVDLTGPTDSDWAVSGAITVANDTPFAATIDTVSDTVSPGISVTPECGVEFPYVLAAGSALHCTYASNLPDAANRVNTATVVTTGPVEGGEATAAVQFGEPTTVVGHSSIHVDDTNGATWTTAADATWNYSKTYACPADLGAYDGGIYAYTVENTATIREDGQADSATVNVTCYAPSATKTAAAFYTRTHEWTIDKSVTPDAHLGFAGDAFTSGYVVAVNETVTESNFAVAGAITVVNPHPTAALEVGVQDMVLGVYATLDCGGTLVVPAGGSAECAYIATLPTKTDGVNHATVTFNGIDVVTAAPYVFGEPTTVVGPPVINVIDTNGEAWTTRDDARWTYNRGFDCPTDAREYVDGVYTRVFPNVATIVETGQADDADVTVTCYLPSQASVVKAVTDGSEDIGQYPFVFELVAPNGVVVETMGLTDAGTAAFSTNLVVEGTWMVRELVPDGWLNEHATYTFTVDFPATAGQTFTASFNNTEMSRVELIKLTDGVDTTAHEWSFALYTGGFGGTLVAADATPPALLEFGATNLDPGATYTLCEEGVAAGWTSVWYFDLDGDGVIGLDEVVTPYNPNSTDDPPADVGNRCLDIGDGTPYAFLPGEALMFKVDNQHPGGGPRTPGYWKNWNSCTNGNQAQTAAANGGAAEGFYLLEDLLPQTIGDFTIEDCSVGVSVLDMRDLDRNRKQAKDAAYKLARNLLAAHLNLAAGAETCAAVQSAVIEGNSVLSAVSFDATGRYFTKGAHATYANQLAATLDLYNNGDLCSP